MNGDAEPAPLRDVAPRRERFREEVLAGLRARPKSLPCKYLYDARGSALFERICRLPEYYPTRTELGIMETHAAEMAAVLGLGCLLIELGSGSGRKTRLLLEHLKDPAGYVPIDISRAALESSALALARAFGALEILPVCADYTQGFEIPRPRRRVLRRVVYFPGSTIGNLAPPDAREFLARIAALVGRAGGLLIGVDLEKAPRLLEPAYDDPAGVTAEFNRNLLVRINRELGGNFEPARFRHHAFWNAGERRIEMHLVSETQQTVRVDGTEIGFVPGESIHTENSYKYSPAAFAALAAEAGFDVRGAWTDPGGLFSVQYLEPA